MKEPLNQFAERIIRNGEVTEFIRGLIAKGADAIEIAKATVPEGQKVDGIYFGDDEPTKTYAKAKISDSKQARPHNN